MSATERLRELLDERGADYRVSATGYSIDIGPYTTAYANRSDTTLDVSLRQVTPEQAIAATLGAVEYRKPTTLSQLEAENAKLREQMERLVTLLRNDCDIDASWDGLRGFWLIGLTEDGCLMRDRACKAEAENDKLREELELWHRLTAGIELPEYPMTQFQPREHFEPKVVGE